MRIPSHHSVRLARALVITSLFALAACGGGSGSSNTLPNTNALCDSNAGAISLARPTPSFPANGNAIEIVASTNNDQLNQFPGQFDLNLVDQFGNEIDTGFLTPVSDTNGFHPYTNDFFYAGNLNTTLNSGRTYTVYLNAPNTACQRGQVGSFST